MISDSMASATIEQWMQFYEHPLMEGLALAPPMEEFSSDATLVAKSPTISSSDQAIFNSSSSSTTSSSSQLIPIKASISKPIRKRSRASKRSPTTLLNANTTNFRALVQQFTGCPSTTMFFGVHKGPVTLDFQQGRRTQQIHHNSSTGRIMAPFGNRSYYHNQLHQGAASSLPVQQQKQLPAEEQVLLPQQQSGYTFDYVKSSNNFLSSSGISSRSASMEVSNGLLVDDDLSNLNDLTMNAFSNDIDIDGCFM